MKTSSNTYTKKGRFSILRLAIEVLSRKFPLISSLAILPAFFLECSKSGELPSPVECDTPLDLRYTSSVLLGGALDLFVFDDDASGRLDSYTHIHEAGGSIVSVASKKGKKRILLMANAGKRLYDWGVFPSFTAAGTATARLEDENPEQPLLCGTSAFEAGDIERAGVVISPILSRIRLKSIQCDFRGRTYAGLTMSEVKAYLTNVCTAASLAPPDSLISGTEYVNIGGWADGDTSGSRLWSMLRCDIPGQIGAEKVTVGKSFYCYPNPIAVGNSRKHVTKLVIEGTIGGHTYYYPVALSASSGGIARGSDYEVSVTITQLGTDDPDGSLAAGAASVDVSVNDWKDKAEKTVTFN